MSRPTVSVCIVTCNQRGLIAQCIRSVLEQSVDADVAILVGDDASDDGTSEIVQGLATEYPSRIHHIRRNRRMGSFENMRDLVALADADFIAHVDGDDYWLPGKLQRQLDYLRAHPDCAAVYTNAVTVDEAGHRIGLFNDVGDARFDLAAMLRRGNFLNSSSVLFRTPGKAAWSESETPQIDYRAHLWHAQRGWLGHLGEPLAAYRVATQGSMVAGMNDHVRELYWEAIQSVPRERVSNGDYARGLADFLRRVFFRTLRTRRWYLLREWHARVLAASPYGAMRTDMLTLASILRMGWKEAVGRFRRDADGRRLRVLYRR
jgi:glycosyltransferase involved in cell wall biosynthesis